MTWKQSTCFIFANQLAVGHVKLEECTVLQESKYAEQQAQLTELLAADMPAIGL